VGTRSARRRGARRSVAISRLRASSFVSGGSEIACEDPFSPLHAKIRSVSPSSSAASTTPSPSFLIALAAFDRKRRWSELGYASLFYFLTRELGLPKGPAYYRKTAAELIQKYPEIVEPLRDGRLSLSTSVEVSSRDALSHSHPGASDDVILELGLDLIIDRHRKRRGIGAKPRKPARAHEPLHPPEAAPLLGAVRGVRPRPRRAGAPRPG
jgi:hypothetical protein